MRRPHVSGSMLCGIGPKKMASWPINQPGDATILDVPTDILCSFHYFNGIDMGKVASWGTRIIGDSGAFSAMSLGKEIDRETFHAWAKRWEDDLFWAAALDVIGDPEASYQNWLAARRDDLELVPTVHYGQGTEMLDRYAEEGATLIALGGMVPYSSEKDRLMRWCLQMHRHVRDHHPQVRFHGLGISHPYLVDNLPWWSTDSSGFSSCFRFGTLRLWVPKKGRFVSVNLNGRDLAKHSRLMRETYGIDWKRVSTSTPVNRRELGRVALRSVQLYAEWLQSRQQVTPPALLIPKLEKWDSASCGPLSVGAWGESTGAPGVALVPEGRLLSKAHEGAGPRAVAALGAPEMQPVKAISPEDAAPKVKQASKQASKWPAERSSGSDERGHRRYRPGGAEGPLTFGAMGGGFSAQGQALTPSGATIMKELS